jgi:hypothetical protein
MKTFINILLLLLFFVILISCNDKSVELQTEILKSPFDMTWTADTIYYAGSYQTLMSSMWASSSSDVWVAGHNSDSRGEIYHYDGKNWTEVDPMNDVPRSTKSINKIMGLTSNNIWMVGDRRGYSRKDLIINWNGTKWIEHNLNLQVRPISLYVNKSDDVWVGCDSAVVLHYNGSTWERDIPKLYIPQGSEYFIKGIVVKDNYTYINVNVYDVQGKRYLHYFLKGTLKNWTLLDSMEVKNSQSVIKWGNWGLTLGNSGNIYSFGDGGVWIYSNNSWQRTLTINYSMINVYELNDSYKITVGIYGMVWFYDGTQWQQMTKFYSSNGDINIYDAWTNGQEVFLIGHLLTNPQKTIVWRGK